MQITGSVEGDMDEIIQEQTAALSVGLRQGVERATATVQEALRSQVRSAGLGLGLEKAWRSEVYPKNRAPTLHPGGLIYSKAVLLHTVYTEGATITARAGRYLAIPTAEAERMGFATTNTNRAGKGTGSIPRRASMVADAIARLGAKNTATLPLARGRKLLVYKPPGGKKGQTAKPIGLFLLIPTVRLTPRLDVDSVRAAAEGILAGEIAAALG